MLSLILHAGTRPMKELGAFSYEYNPKNEKLDNNSFPLKSTADKSSFFYFLYTYFYRLYAISKYLHSP
jgi:hypothetical protein